MPIIRPLHFNLKIGDRRHIYKFFIDTLKMKIIRHEEFETTCLAGTNGVSEGKWSRTLLGYGPENVTFTLAIIYNYEVKKYVYGNSLHGFTITSSGIADFIRTEMPWPFMDFDNGVKLAASEGYPFLVIPPQSFTSRKSTSESDSIFQISLITENIGTTCKFWVTTLGLRVVEEDKERLLLRSGTLKWRLEFLKDSKVNHGTAFGRIEFACPTDQLYKFEAKIKAFGIKNMKPVMSLETPGKPTVKALVFSDPNDHEVCLIEDEAFKLLSKTDNEASRFLTKAIQDESATARPWFPSEVVEDLESYSTIKKRNKN